jgi:hypothetical protein
MAADSSKRRAILGLLADAFFRNGLAVSRNAGPISDTVRWRVNSKIKNLQSQFQPSQKELLCQSKNLQTTNTHLK